MVAEINVWVYEEALAKKVPLSIVILILLKRLAKNS
jgi:hypothetical protein